MKFWHHTLFHIGRKLQGDSRGLYFMQDGAGPHWANKIKGFLEKSEIQIVSWPSSSPDLNLIENVWRMLKQRLGKQFRKDILADKLRRSSCGQPRKRMGAYSTDGA